MEVVTDGRSHREMEHRLNALQTSINMVKTSITKFENLLEDCRMVEEEVRCIEEDKAHQEEKAEETANIEMVEEEERSNPKFSGPRKKADTKDIPLLSPVGIPSPLSRMLSSCRKHPNLRIQWLDLTAPGVRLPQSWEGWLSYASYL